MPKKDICAISDLDHLSKQQYVSAIKKFVNVSCSSSFYSTSVDGFNIDNVEQYRKLVVESERWKSLTDVIQLKTEQLLLCFDSNDEFVCMRDQVKFSSYNIVLPKQINAIANDFNGISLSFADKCSLLYQCSIADSNGMLEISWHHLCIPQMLSIAQYLGLNLSFTQIQNSQNPSNFIEAKCRQSRQFRENYGFCGNFRYLTFSFSVDSILEMLGLSLCFPSAKDSVAPDQCVTNHIDQPSLSNRDELKLGENSVAKNSGICCTEEDTECDKSLSVGASNNLKEASLSQHPMVSKNSKEIEEQEETSSSSSSVSHGSFPSTSGSTTQCDTQTPPTHNGTKDPVADYSIDEISYSDATKESPQPIQQSTPLLRGGLKAKQVDLVSNVLSSHDSIELIKCKSRSCKTSSCKEGRRMGHENGLMEHGQSILKQLTVDNELSIWMDPFKEEHDVLDGLCVTCKEYCNGSCLMCYVCDREIHFSCYNSQGTKPLSEREFIESSKLNNHKWFCNDCVNLTINDILAIAAGKVKSSIQNSCEFLNDSSYHPEPCSAHEDLYDIQSPKEHHLANLRDSDIVKESFTAAKNSEIIYSDISLEDNDVGKSSVEAASPCKSNNELEQSYASIVQKVNQCISEKINELKEFITKEVKPPQSETYAKMVSDKVQSTKIGQTRNREIISNDLAPDPQESTSVNKSNSVVIRNIQERKYIKDAPSIKKEFNNHFPQVKIISAFPTRSGALIIELNSKEEAKQVEKCWKSSFFCPLTKSSDENYNTSCTVMAQIETLKVIVKNVEYGLADNTITSELSKTYPGAAFQRFITRQGKALKTGIIHLKLQAHVSEILDLGRIRLCNMQLETQKYVSKRKVIQCFKCKQFDHVQKWCPNDYSCSNCSENHQESDCRTPDVLQCTNCKRSHSSKDRNCPVFIHKKELNDALLKRYND